MKTSLFTLLLTFFISISAWSQSAITVTSNDSAVRFFLMIGDQQMNDFFDTYVQIQNVPQGYHEVKVVFEGDSIADCFKNVLIKNGQEKIFLVKEKSDIKKSVNKSGRQVGEVAKIGEHKDEFKYLQDIYYLDLLNKDSFVPTGTALEVSTEKTLSTSVLPATKTKH